VARGREATVDGELGRRIQTGLVPVLCKVSTTRKSSLRRATVPVWGGYGGGVIFCTSKGQHEKDQADDGLRMREGDARMGGRKRF
jgi:hypothetical protein